MKAWLALAAVVVVTGGGVGFYLHEQSSAPKTCEQVLRDAFHASQTDPSYKAPASIPPECSKLSQAQYVQLAMQVQAGK